MARFTPKSLLRGVYYYSLSVLATFYLLFIHTIARHLKRASKYCTSNKQQVNAAVGKPSTAGQSHHIPWSIKNCPISHRTLTTDDGTSLTYHLMYPTNVLQRPPSKVMVFANGLGLNSTFDVYASIVHRYGAIGGDWCFLTWEYRGLFSSGGNIKVPRRLAIPNHAEDLKQILDKEGLRANVLVGYSMGVQVSLEFASLYPNAVDRLVLLNGTYGNVFETACQPFVRVPFVSSLVSNFVETLLDHPWLLRVAIRTGRPLVWLFGKFYQFFLQQELLTSLLGDDYFDRFLHGYLLDVISTPIHTSNYLRLFQELNAHSTYHLLRHIDHPTLIVSGLLDVLTPAYLSFEMSKKLKHSKHVVAYLSSHCVLLEQPVLLLRELHEFLSTPLPAIQASPSPAAASSSSKVEEVVESWASKVNLSNAFQRAAEYSALLNPKHQARSSGSAVGFASSNAAANSTTAKRTFQHEIEHSQARVGRPRSATGDECSESEMDSQLRQEDFSTRTLTFDAEMQNGNGTHKPTAEITDADGLSVDAAEAAANEYSIEALLGSSSIGGQVAESIDEELNAEDIACEEERMTIKTQLEEKKHKAPAAAAAKTAASKLDAKKSSTIAVEPPSITVPLLAADGSTPLIGVLTCLEMDNRKQDDRALIESLNSSESVRAEHVIWNKPHRAWSDYAAIVVKSPWHYYKHPAKWLQFLATIEELRIPVANPVSILRWNARKTYIKTMEESITAKYRPLDMVLLKPTFGFIPTAWLKQSDLTAKNVERIMIEKGWTVTGAVLKPTSSAGGFATIRLETVGNKSFSIKVAEAAGYHLNEDGMATKASAADSSGSTSSSPSKSVASAPITWMLQPFQPQIISDGEYSFFFLNCRASPAEVPHLRFLHAGVKVPKANSFLVQPTNGGILSKINAPDWMIKSALDMIDHTPATKRDEFFYVRVDCIRERDPETGCLLDRLLLMEIEAIEPDYYSHLTAGFDVIYSQAVTDFLQRMNVYPAPPVIPHPTEGEKLSPAKKLSQPKSTNNASPNKKGVNKPDNNNHDQALHDSALPATNGTSTSPDKKKQHYFRRKNKAKSAAAETGAADAEVDSEKVQ